MEPIPLNRHLTIVLGDACIYDSEQTWDGVWLVLRDHFTSHVPPRSLVAVTAEWKCPDWIGLVIGRRFGHHVLRYEHDGRVVTWPVEHAVTNEVPLTTVPSGSWSEGRVIEGKEPLSELSALAMRAWLAVMSGWDVRVLVFAGWRNSWRSEAAVSAFEHAWLHHNLAVYDVSDEGQVMQRPRDEHERCEACPVDETVVAG